LYEGLDTVVRGSEHFQNDDYSYTFSTPCPLPFEELQFLEIASFQEYRTLGTSNFAILGSELKAKEPDATTQHSNNHHIG
jgi:hypothetical protein